MQEQQDTTVSSLDETVTSTETSAAATPAAKGNAMRLYLMVGVAVIIITLTLVFFLEREGRLSTGIFSGVIASLEAKSPVAIVNGVEIARKDFDSSFNQLMQMAAAQGADVTDQQVIAEYQTQTIDTLVNGELLRQAALAAGHTATPEAVDARYGEIRDGLGGAEVLASRMAEIGVTEASLRRDIENEILIQSLFKSELPSAGQEVTEEEVKALYDQLGGETAGIPPLSDVYEEVVNEIIRTRQQAEVQPYLQSLREEANIEVMLE